MTYISKTKKQQKTTFTWTHMYTPRVALPVAQHLLFSLAFFRSKIQLSCSCMSDSFCAFKLMLSTLWTWVLHVCVVAISHSWYHQLCLHFTVFFRIPRALCVWVFLQLVNLKPSTIAQFYEWAPAFFLHCVRLPAWLSRVGFIFFPVQGIVLCTDSTVWSNILRRAGVCSSQLSLWFWLARLVQILLPPPCFFIFNAPWGVSVSDSAIQQLLCSSSNQGLNLYSLIALTQHALERVCCWCAEELECEECLSCAGITLTTQCSASRSFVVW